MIGDDDRRAVGDLALRALDKILDEYGEDAELIAATLVFEVKATDEEGDVVYHGNYESLENSRPHHLSGLLRTTADYMVS